MESVQNPPTVFLSYSNEDKYLAGQVKAFFSARGISVFLAHEDMEASDEWRERIRNELKTCNVFVPVITKNFRSSEWTDQEVGFAVSRSKLKARRCLILSLVVAPVQMPHGFLKDFQALPIAITTDLNRALRRAVDSIYIKLGLEGQRKEAALKAFCASRSFASAAQNADELMAFAPFSLPETARIAEASVTNNQIYQPAELRHRVRRLLSIRLPELDPQLKVQVEQYFP